MNQKGNAGLKTTSRGEAWPSAPVAKYPSAPASVKALRPLRGVQDRAILTDAYARGEALL